MKAECERKGDDSSGATEPVKLKVVVVGDSAVGKSCISSRFTTSTFRIDQQTTVCVDYAQRSLRIRDHHAMVSVWDTAGQERYMAVAAGFFHMAAGVVLVYDVTSLLSLRNCLQWLEMVRRFLGEVPVVLVGNKIDLERSRQVSAEEGESFAARLGLKLVEASAKAAVGIEDAFKWLLEQIFVRREEAASNSDTEAEPEDDITLGLEEDYGSGSGCC